MASLLANPRGGTNADFRRQAPRPPTDRGRDRPLHDDRDGPAGEPPEDAPPGEPEGRDLCGDGGGEGRGHAGPGIPRERVPARPGIRGGSRHQSVCPARPYGPVGGPRAIRVREEGELAAHDPPRWLVRGEGEATRGERREAAAFLQSGRTAGHRGPSAEGREND